MTTSLPIAAGTWWTEIPGRLHRYSRFASAISSDGIYLSAWPRTSAIVMVATVLFGLFEGATHWSPVVIDSTRLSTSIPAVSFMQMMPLLFVTAFIGALSANLGLMMVVGFAAGDYLIAGPALTLDPWAPIPDFFRLRVPQLYSYGIFVALAVLTTIFAFALLNASIPRFRTKGRLWIVLRIAAAAVLQGLLVYLWILIAPTTLRVTWAWAHRIPPIAVSDYKRMLIPWLPATAAIGTLLRAVLVYMARSKPSRNEALSKLSRRLWQSDQDVAVTRKMPLWLRSLLAALIVTLLLAGMIGNWWLVALVLLASAGICLLRNCLLPELRWWKKWSALMNRVPIALRVAIAYLTAYFLTSFLLRLPGWTLRENNVPGDFRVILGCIGIGLLVAVVLVPYVPEPTAINASDPGSLSVSPRFVHAIRVLLLVTVIGASVHVYAICLDPFCCYSSPSDADIAAAAMVAGAIMAIGGIFALGMLAGGALAAGAAAEGVAVAAGEAAVAGAADAAAADAAAIGAADTLPGFGAIADIGAADTLPGGLQYAPVRVGWIPPQL
jgi:hypothetical protein